MNRIVAAALVLLGLLSLHGCARDIRSEVGVSGLAQLRTESETLWKRRASEIPKSSPRGLVLAKEDWPRSIHAIGPEEVQVRQDGVYLVVAMGYLDAQILFVPCPTCAAIDASAKRNVREIAPRVYDLSAR